MERKSHILSMEALQETSISFETISDGSEESGKLEIVDARLEDFTLVVSQSLGKLIERQNSSQNPPKLLIYDSVMPWALNVARQLGVDGAPFFTQSCAVNEANWIFCNTFDKLEHEYVVSWMASRWPVKTIGPTIPSMFLDKRLEDDKTLGEEQMEEFAWGLKNSNCYFLWVVRKSEEKKLPNNFLQETAEKGLVVTWCPQLDVLAHKAIGCFMTHCGWNSTLEALSLGVPMIAMPQWTDQPTNAKFIEDVWNVGIRIKLNEKGIVTKEEIELSVSEGGSSDKNIEEFLAKLAHS
ncbi:hypothetical protein SLA2020_286840 [Shorea laevis]